MNVQLLYHIYNFRCVFISCDNFVSICVQHDSEKLAWIIISQGALYEMNDSGRGLVRL